jgi:Fe-S-cluster containining protein
MRRSDIDAALAELYARVPEIPDCKGRCWISCGPIDMSVRERQRLREAGYKITDWQVAKGHPGKYWCEALDGAGRCAAYERRPLICRIWGAAEGLPCPYGCRPVPRYLTDVEAARLLAEAMEVGGHAAAVGGMDRLLANLGPAERALIRDKFLQGREWDQVHAGEYLELPPAVTRRAVRGER